MRIENLTGSACGGLVRPVRRVRGAGGWSLSLNLDSTPKKLPRAGSREFFEKRKKIDIHVACMRVFRLEFDESFVERESKAKTLPYGYDVRIR